MSYTNLKLFALSSNQELAAKVADKMGIESHHLKIKCS